MIPARRLFPVLLAELQAGRASWAVRPLGQTQSTATYSSRPEETPRPPLPPFTLDSARQKVQLAEDAWNSKDPEKVSLAYTPDSKWRNRAETFQGREAIKTFLTRKWAKEQGYRLKKELWSYTDNKIAVKFEYEWHDTSGNWTRSYGVELWSFAPDGRMAERHASINDAPVSAAELRVAKPSP